MPQNVRFLTGTKAQYDALATKDSLTLYWLYDIQELRKGEELYGTGNAATQLVSGLMSAADKAKLDSLKSVSSDEGNALEVRDTGLFVPVPKIPVVPEYAIEALETPTEGYAASYRLKVTGKDGVSYMGDIINIPAVGTSTTLVWEELE